MSKLSQTQKAAINPEECHAIQEQVPELFEAIKQQKPASDITHQPDFNLKVAAFVKTLKAEKEAIDLKEYHRKANEALYPALAEAIMKLRPVLSHFRDHEFIGVPMVRKLPVSKLLRIWDCKEGKHFTYYSFTSIRGKWLNKLGFKEASYIQVLELNGLLIVCPEIIHDYTEPRPAKKIPFSWREEAGLRYIKQPTGEYISGYK